MKVEAGFVEQLEANQTAFKGTFAHLAEFSCGVFLDEWVDGPIQGMTRLKLPRGARPERSVFCNLHVHLV